MSMGIRYTRGFLLDLRRRLTFVRDAHELLEMKRDQLVRELKEAIEKLKEMRAKVEKEVKELNRELAMIHAIYGSQEILSGAQLLKESLELEVIPKSIMGVDVPEVKIRKIPKPEKACPPHILRLAEKASVVVRGLIEIAELEAFIERIAEDLRKTNVRVNALEKVVIPSYEALIKRISDIIDQSALGEFMRIKLVKRALAKRRLTE